MLRLANGYKRKIVLLMLLCNLFLLCYLCARGNLFQSEAAATARLSSSKEQSNCDQLLVNTYLKRIEEASNNFYEEYYTLLPIVNYYSVTVKECSSEGRLGRVTFTSNPYLGPHDSIGIDEITFSADYLGNVKLESFQHIISYYLPDNLKDLEKKRVPGKYAGGE